jgi:hypothetical protein
MLTKDKYALFTSINHYGKGWLAAKAHIRQLPMFFDVLVAGI